MSIQQMLLGVGAVKEFELWLWGDNEYGNLGLNAPETSRKSSPTQITGTKWENAFSSGNQSKHSAVVKNDGTLWVWGRNDKGQLGLNDLVNYSSPTQVPGTTWAGPTATDSEGTTYATKSDGTMWAWGRNNNGNLGQGTSGGPASRSSPVQIPGTTWPTDLGSDDGVIKLATGADNVFAIKTDNTLWSWGQNYTGQLGQNNATKCSSPKQVPGSWKSIGNDGYCKFGVKTDGTAYYWGQSNDGYSGINLYEPQRSSPTQLHGGGTTWKHIAFGGTIALAVKTDGTMWGCGNNSYGQAAFGNPDTFPQGSPGRSAPIQIGNQTNWKFVQSAASGGASPQFAGLKTDGTLWTWGLATFGTAGNNTVTPANAGYSSPVQIPGTDWKTVALSYGKVAATKQV